MMDVEEIQAKSLEIRIAVLEMISKSGSSHVGSALSIVDLLTCLYFNILKIDELDDKWPLRDRFILSKAHAGAALYATLALRGFFEKELLKTYYQNGSRLPGHADRHGVPGIEVSSGCLGHGLAIGTGMAYAQKYDSYPSHTYVLMSDGECNEGSVWEAALFASTHKLDNLFAIVDYNRLQGMGSVEEIIQLEPMVEKWASFGWRVLEVNGHEHAEIISSLKRDSKKSGKPTLVLAHTTKGKGVSFMENDNLWHYRTPNADELKEALLELKAIL